MSRHLTIALSFGLVQVASAQMTRSVDRRMVTGQAAAALRAAGTFALPDSVVHPAGQLSDEDVLAFIKEFVGRAAAPGYSIVPCSRPVYARSAFEPLGAGVSPMTRRRFGPHWVVALCDGGSGRPTRIMTLSALTTDLRSSSEKVRWNALGDADLMTNNYPAAANPDMFSPEGVARIAFNLTGRRIATVPDLIDVLPPSNSAAPRWRVTLESPVHVRTESDTMSRSRSVLFIGFSRIFLRSGLLDEVSARNALRDAVLTDPITHGAYKAALAPGVPDSLVLISVVK